MLILLLEAPCILPFQVKKQTPIIDCPWTQIRALLNYMNYILTLEICQDKLYLPITTMFQNSFNNKELISFKIERTDSRPPKARSNNIFYIIIHHVKIIPYFPRLFKNNNFTGKSIATKISRKTKREVGKPPFFKKRSEPRFYIFTDCLIHCRVES